MNPAPTLDLSIILPCFNEAGCVETLTDEIVDVIRLLGLRYEIIFVDDCSTDGTLGALSRAQLKHPVVRTVSHSTNCGQSAAIATGFHRARGSIVIVMDSDRQNDPADIPRMLEALQGHDCVATRRRSREDQWLKRVSSRIANRFRIAVTGVAGVSDAGCAYRAIRSEALREILIFNGMHRFLPTILLLQGFRITEIDVSHRSRTTGKSNYGIGDRLWRGIADCIAIRWYRRRVLPARRTRSEGD